MNVDIEAVKKERLNALRNVPELRGLSDDELRPLADALELRVHPRPARGASFLASAVGVLSMQGDDTNITKLNTKMADRQLSIVLDGHIRLVQIRGNERWERTLGPGTMFNEEGVAAALGRPLPVGLRIGAKSVGRAWLLEISPQRVMEILGTDPSKSPVLARILRGFEGAIVAPHVIDTMKRDPNLGTARLDDLYALAEGAPVLDLKRGESLPNHRAGEVPKMFHVVVDGELVTEEGRRYDSALPIGLREIIRKLPFKDALQAGADTRLVSIGADRFQELLYGNADFFRAISSSMGLDGDALRQSRDGALGRDVVLMAAREGLEPPLGPLVDLLAESIASHMYDRTCVLHVLAASATDVPSRRRIDAPHQDGMYDGTTPVCHEWVRLDDEGGFGPVDRAIARLKAETWADGDVAYDVILVDVSALAQTSRDAHQSMLTEAGRLLELTKIVYVLAEPTDEVPLPFMLRRIEVVTIGLLGPRKDQSPLGLLAHRLQNELEDAPLAERVQRTADFVTSYAATRTRRRAESLQRKAKRLLYPWRYGDPGWESMAPWPPRTTRVRIESDLRAAALSNAESEGKTLRLADFGGSIESINRWARGVTGRRVGLALGGGGAYGYVHASLIRALRAQNIPIDLVSGSSFGAVVGAYYAGGDTNFERLQDHWWLMTAAVSVGIVSTVAMTLAIDLDVGAYDMNELEVSYYPVVTDADTGSETCLRRGTLGRGVRASGSLPPMAPTLEGVRRLLDGGLVANVPIQVLHDEGAGMIIASNPIPDPDPRDPTPPLPIPILGPFLRTSNPVDRLMDGFRSTLILMRAAGTSQERFADLMYQAETRGTTMFSFSERLEIMKSAVDDPERRLRRTVDTAVSRWRRRLRRPPARVRLLETAEIAVPGIGFTEHGGRELLTNEAKEILVEVARFLRETPRILEVEIYAVVRPPPSDPTAPVALDLAATEDAALERCQRIKDELVRLGIAEERFAKVSFGPPRTYRHHEIELVATRLASAKEERDLAEEGARQLHKARRRGLCDAAEKALDAGVPDLAALLALEAFRRGPDAHLDGVLRRVLRVPVRSVASFDRLPQANIAMAWSPDGRWLARGAKDVVQLLSSEGHPPITMSSGYDVRWLAWSPDGTRLATTDFDHSECIYDTSGLKAGDTRQPPELMSRSTSTWAVWGVAFSPDGTRLLGTADATSAAIWELETNREYSLGHEAKLIEGTWRADGRQVATAAEDRQIKLWNADGSLVRVLMTAPRTIGCLAFRPTERALVAAVGNTALLWRDVDDDSPPIELAGHHRRITCVAWSSTKAAIATASDDLTIRLWDGDTGALVNVLWGHTGPIQRLTWHATEDYLASGAADESARVWDGNTGRLVAKIGVKSSVWSLQWHPKILVLATGGADGRGQLWDSSPRGPVSRPAPDASPYVVAWSPSASEEVLMTTQDGFIEIWNAASGQSVRKIRDSDGTSIEAGWRPTDGRAVCYGRGDELTVLDLETNVPNVMSVPLESIERIRWSKDGRYIALSGLRANRDGFAVALVDTHAMRVLAVSEKIDAVTSMAWSPDSKQLVIGLFGGFDQVRVWTVDDPAPTVLAHVGDGVWSVAWSHDGAYVAAACNNRTAFIASVDGAEQWWVPHDGEVRDVAWSPTELRLASVANDRMLRICDVATRDVTVRTGHTAKVTKVAWRPDGRFLITAGDDTTARIWPADGEAAPSVLNGHTNELLGVSFRADGSRVLTWSTDGNAEVHLASTSDLADMVARCVTRKALTPEEWAQYMPDDEEPRPTID